MTQAGAGRACSNCGTVNGVNEQFCANCGYALNSNTSAPTQMGQVAANAPTFVSPSLPTARRITGALQAHTVLEGRYRVVRMVGQGGFGAVYEATDERFQARRVVAIKEMSDAQLNPTEKVQAIQDFRREADLLVSLKHPNLPNVSDFFEEGGKAYLVMEFVEGKTLEKVQEDANAPLGESMIMGKALQLCDVLSYLHTQPQPIIFRDMKPSNVMLTKDGQIKLIDFGIARNFKSTASKDTQSLGSRGYAPLEQYGKGQSDARSDIYALGATLYDLLTHSTPTDAITRRIQKMPLTQPRQLNPRISQATENILLKAMEEEPQQRFQTAQQMYQAIEASGVASTQPQVAPLAPVAQPVQAVQVGSPQSPARTISRRALLAGGGAVVIAATAVASEGIFNWPVPLSRGAAGLSSAGKIGVDFIYSTEKAAWLGATIDDFNKQQQTFNGKTIEIRADASGSLDVTNQISAGNIHPVAWSPASQLELKRFTFKWQQTHGAADDIIVNTGELGIQSLVSSPLVFAVWRERADAFLKHYSNVNWLNIADALKQKNWSTLGGSSDWGAVKFGQTRPTLSNSGLLTITLMAYDFFKQQRQLTQAQVRDPKFLAYLDGFESAVNGFGLSSGTYMEKNIIPDGPARADIVMNYESLVLTLQKAANNRQHQPLLLFYPELNIVSDHPFAIFNGPWVSDEQKRAAKVFRDFLLTEAQQRRALQNGFRPVNTNVQIADLTIPDNPFSQMPQLSPRHTIGQAIEPLAQAPTGDVIDALLQQWDKMYSSAS